MEWGSVFCPSELFILLLSKDFLTITHENVGCSRTKNPNKRKCQASGLKLVAVALDRETKRVIYKVVACGRTMVLAYHYEKWSLCDPYFNVLYLIISSS